jgi:2-methylisocitrate lyase-like PEP mutase family enzyme
VLNEFCQEKVDDSERKSFAAARIASRRAASGSGERVGRGQRVHRRADGISCRGHHQRWPANALGYADGQYVPWAEMVAAIRKICQAVSAPVTADIESGFAQDEDGLRRSITQVIEAGAAGVNLEDVRPGGQQESLFPLPEQQARIRAVRDESEKLKLHLVINARTDAFWLKGQLQQAAVENTLERGKAYLDAGADCIFVPGLRDPEKIRMFVDAWKAPINILAGAGVPSIAELAKLGVKRVSFGSGPMRAAMGLLRKIGEEAKSQGTCTAMTDLAVPYDELNALLARSSSHGNR